MKKRCLFLDRDGVINVDGPYISKGKDIRFLPGIFDLVGEANKCGYVVLVVTNQSGIGRGFFGESDFLFLMRWMSRQFESRGARLDGVYHCPEVPGLMPGAGCRKPDPHMVLQASKQHNIRLSESIMVGNNHSDIEAGWRAKIGRLYQLTGQTLHPRAIPIRLLKSVALEN